MRQVGWRRPRRDAQTARTQLEAVLAADPNDVEALYLTAVAHVQEAENAPPEAAEAALREARRRLVQGFRADPDHFPTLYLYARTHQQPDAPMTEAHIDVLARAFELAPQVTEIRFALARELMLAERYDDAIGVLRALVYSPHSAADDRRARAMTEAARRREPPPPHDDAEEDE